MAEIIKFKRNPVKSEHTANFLEQLDFLRELYLQGELDNVFVIANGRSGKCCTSNGVNIANAKEMCRNFISKPKEYID